MNTKDIASQARNTATELMMLSDMLRGTEYAYLANEAYIVAFGLTQLASELDEHSSNN